MSKWLFAAKTEDEARARLSEHIELLNWTGGYWASQVEDLKLVASMSADGKVRLTADDAGILEGHWPNEGEENG